MFAIFKDIVARSFFMSFFIVLIPLGAYTIHNGSSAVVAMCSYLFLSVIIPLLYLTSKRSGFGPRERRVGRWAYVIGWFIVQAITYQSFFGVDSHVIFSLPTVGRDAFFCLFMYIQVLLALLIAYILSALARKREVA